MKGTKEGEEILVPYAVRKVYFQPRTHVLCPDSDTPAYRAAGVSLRIVQTLR